MLAALLSPPGRRFSDLAPGRENNFNLLRVLAASGVVLSHAYPLTLGAGVPEPLSLLLKGDNLGRLCIFVFFAISGFFIAASYERSSSVWDYVKARLLRIYPALIVMLCLMLPLSLLIAPGEGRVLHWAARFAADSVLMLSDFSERGEFARAVFPENPLPGAFNGSLWTLRHEMLCYALILLAGRAGLLRSRPAVLMLLALAVAGYYLVPQLTYNVIPRTLSYVGLPFAFGAAAWVWRASLPHDGRIALLLLAAAALAWPTALFFPVMIAAVTYGVLWLGYLEVPALTGFSRIGDYSYGIYVYAFPVQQILVTLGVTALVPHMVLALLVTLCFAIPSWHLVEKPALALRGPNQQGIRGR